MKPDVSTFTIPNGLTVVHTFRPDSLNVSICLAVIAGAIYESADGIGVAHFLEHIVSDGTEKYPTEKQVSEVIDEIGGVRGATTSKETVEYTVKVLNEYAESAFEYVSEISLHSLIKEKDIEKQKKIIEQEISRFKSDPEKFAQRFIYSAVFPDTRAEVFTTGDVEDVIKITRSAIISYRNRTHCANNMVISVCGNITKEKTEELAKKYFGTLASGMKTSEVKVSATPLNDPVHYVNQNPKQAVVAVGYQSFKFSEEEHYAADLLSMVLSRGKSSRLFYEIREKRALAYAVGSSNFSARNIGLFTIYAGLSREKVNEGVELIKNEAKKLYAEELSQKELKKILAFARSNVSFSFENSLAEAIHYARMWCYSGKVGSIYSDLDSYASMISNPEIIKKAAEKIFAPEPGVVVI